MAMVSTTAPWHQSALVGATLNRWLEPTLRVDSTEPVAEIIAKLNAYQPRCLIAYANTARLLAQEQLSGSLKISPEAVFSVSEVLTKDSRNLIDKAWYARSFNIYGATETAGIASECSERQKLHIYEDLVIIEVVDENNKPVEPGEYGAKLLVTVLFSRTLPLIRYEISDSVRLSADSCHCRRPFALMTDIQGRAEDVIDLSGESGSIVSVQPNLFHDIMEMFPVGGWQVTQEQSNALKISILNPAPAFREDNLRELISTKLFKLGAVPTSVKVEYVTSLPKGALGKTYLVKSLKGASQTRTQ
ncbi:MAG: phenylacetate--CoA ligase family protein [Chloroflexi bacterium]|nr:phenylacetate--CoA ligase family protein [Chloroflexota bacterium]